MTAEPSAIDQLRLDAERAIEELTLQPKDDLGLRTIRVAGAALALVDIHEAGERGPRPLAQELVELLGVWGIYVVILGPEGVSAGGYGVEGSGGGPVAALLDDIHLAAGQAMDARLRKLTSKPNGIVS